jgi:hypothetical protein
MYRPAIVSARRMSVFQVGDGTATLLTDVEPAGWIRYGYVMEFRDQYGVPYFYVAAEEELNPPGLESGTQFLCTYRDGTHRNHGSAANLIDAYTFCRQAIRMCDREFGRQIDA